jgi:hypothetical protein
VGTSEATVEVAPNELSKPILASRGEIKNFEID